MLHQLKSIKTKKNRKRVGRGYGSGKGGHTATRGQKGQKSRTGYKSPRPDFEGGAMPLSRRLPKLKGFSRNFLKAKVNSIIISLDQLDKNFKSTDNVTLESLKEKGLIKGKSQNVDVKVLAKGKLSKKINIKGLKVSQTAKDIIEKLGGKVK